MKRAKLFVNITFLLGMSLGSPLFGEEGPKTYSGNFWTRSTLTGDWGDVRNDLASKGVTLDMNLAQVVQGVVGGGKDESWKYGGRGNATVKADTQKLGLWPGGFLTVEFEGNFGESVNGNSGAFMAVNTNQIFPLPTGNNLNVPQVSLAQFISPYVGVVLGKMDTMSGDMNEFAHGKGDVQFFNLAFNINPVAIPVVPYSTLGAGLIVLPTKDPDSAAVNFMVLQANGQPDTTGFSDLRADKLVYSGEARVRTGLFGLTGHQVIGVGYSNKEFTSLDQRLRFVLQNQSLEGKKGSWYVSYNFDQYLYEPKKGSGQGIGVFGRFGASDGNPNPVHYFISAGVGGKGMISGRPLDQFGLGYYYIDIKSPTFQGPFQTRSFLRDEHGFEAFYSIAVTPWAHFTPDIQVIRGAQKQKIDNGGGSDINTATVLGFRLNTIF